MSNLCHIPTSILLTPSLGWLGYCRWTSIERLSWFGYVDPITFWHTSRTIFCWNSHTYVVLFQPVIFIRNIKQVYILFSVIWSKYPLYYSSCSLSVRNLNSPVSFSAHRLNCLLGTFFSGASSVLLLGEPLAAVLFGSMAHRTWLWRWFLPALAGKLWYNPRLSSNGCHQKSG